MFEKLIALFERLVVAHERLAASQEALLQNCACTSTDLVDEIKEAVAPSTPAPIPAPAADPAGETTPSGWNPFLAEIQGRYGTDKVATLDALIAEKGIELKARATGAEKHQALLDWANAKKDELAEALAEEPSGPVVTPEPVAPAAEEAAPAVTTDDIRALAQKCMAAKIAPARVQDLLEQHGGSRRLPEVAADKFGAVFAALTKELEG